jgi:Polysaccharide deacetylase/Adenylate and Guanylate cyclase catalytic domain
LGVVTFLFTDVEGSTRRWENDANAMRAALMMHDEVLHTAIEKHDGYVFKHTGDGVCAAFASPTSAVDAGVGAQRALELPVRMGLATGEAELREGDYFGAVLNRAARVMAAGHGGQILLAEYAGDQPWLIGSSGSGRSRALPERLSAATRSVPPAGDAVSSAGTVDSADLPAIPWWCKLVGWAGTCFHVVLSSNAVNLPAITRRTFLAALAGSVAVAGCGIHDCMAIPRAAAAPRQPPASDPAAVAARYRGVTPTQWGTSLPGVATTFAASGRQIALTFDACPGACDDALLSTLERNAVPALLFLNSRWIDAHPAALNN